MKQTLLTTFLAAGVRNFEQEYIFFPTPATLSQPGQGERNRLVSEHNEHQSAPKAKYTHCKLKLRYADNNKINIRYIALHGRRYNRQMIKMQISSTQQPETLTNKRALRTVVGMRKGHVSFIRRGVTPMGHCGCPYNLYNFTLYLQTAISMTLFIWFCSHLLNFLF